MVLLSLAVSPSGRRTGGDGGEIYALWENDWSLLRLGGEMHMYSFSPFAAAFALGFHDGHALALGFQLEKTVASSTAKHTGATLATLVKRTGVGLSGCAPYLVY